MRFRCILGIILVSFEVHFGVIFLNFGAPAAFQKRVFYVGKTHFFQFEGDWIQHLCHTSSGVPFQIVFSYVFLGTWWVPRIDYMSQVAPFGSPWIHFGATYDDWSSPVCQNGRSGWNLDVAEWLRRSKSVFFCRPRAYQMVHFGKLWIHFAVRIFVVLSTRRRMEFCVFFWYQHLEFGTFLRTKTCDCKEPS